MEGATLLLPYYSGHESKEKYKHLRVRDICLLLTGKAGSTIHIWVIRNLIYEGDIVREGVVSFRHKRYGGAVAKYPVKIGKLVLLCPTEQIENSLEESDIEDDAKKLNDSRNSSEMPDIKNNTKASVDVAARKTVIKVINIEDDAEEQYDTEVAKKPTDYPGAEDVLIFKTMGFSNFGNLKYQRRDNQSEV